MAELSAIWAELQEFGEQIEGVPLAELQGPAHRVRGPDPRRRPAGRDRSRGCPHERVGAVRRRLLRHRRRGPPLRRRRARRPRGRARPPRRRRPPGRRAPIRRPRRRRRSPRLRPGRRRRRPRRARRADRRTERGARRHREDGDIRRPFPGGPVSESSAAGAAQHPDLLGIYCNDHLAAATGGIELVSRMLGPAPRHASRDAARRAARRAPRGTGRAALVHGGARAAGPPVQAGGLLDRREAGAGEAQRAPAEPVAAQRSRRVRVHRHGGARQAGRFRDAAGDRGRRPAARRRRCSSGSSSRPTSSTTGSPTPAGTSRPRCSAGIPGRPPRPRAADVEPAHVPRPRQPSARPAPDR